MAGLLQILASVMMIVIASTKEYFAYCALL